MWEYYKAWCVQKPELSKAATLSYADGSYMQTLYQAVSEHLHDVGLSGNKEIASVKSFRDLLGRWCLLGSHYLPRSNAKCPKQGRGVPTCGTSCRSLTRRI